MANKPLQSLTFPGLSDTYTVPQLDATLTQSGCSADAKKVGDELSDLKDDLNAVKDGIIVTSTGDNLVDPSKTVTGAIQSDGTIAVNGTYANYETSDYLELEPNTDYIVEIFYREGHSLSVNRRMLLLYDNDKQPISSTYVNTTGRYTQFNSGSYGFARVSSSNEMYLQVEKGNSETAFKPYTETRTLLQSLPLTETMQNEVSKLADEALTKKQVLPTDGHTIIQGSYDRYGAPTTHTHIIRVDGFLRVNAGEAIKFKQGTNIHSLMLGYFDLNKTYSSDSPWYTTDTTINIESDGFIIPIFKNSTSTNILPSDYDATTVIYSESAILLDSINQSFDALEEKTLEDIGSLRNEITRIADDRIGKNLIDTTLTEEGAIQSNGAISTAGSFASYITSDYIPVDANTSYFLGIFGSGGNYSASSRKIYLLYDIYKNPISTSFKNITTDCIITPTVNGFVRVAWAETALAMLEIGDTHTAYEQYSKEYLLNDDFPLTPTMSEEVGTLSGNPLAGKKWIPCGDSFTYYTNKKITEGRFAGKDASYPRLIAESNDMVLGEDFFLNGRTMAYPADHSFTNSLTCPTNAGYFENIPEDADYVTIMLGINDVNHQSGSGTTPDGEDATGVITLGTIDDTTTSTYFGAYNTVLEWLRTNRPFTHVGIIVTNGTTRQDYTEAQIALAGKWGYPYLNLNGDQFTPAMIRCYNPKLSNSLKTLIAQKQAVDYDGSTTGSVNTHPNWQTHEYEAKIIESWLKTI